MDAQLAAKGGRGFLVLDEVLDVRPPRDYAGIDLAHLGTVAAMDPRRTGRFERGDLAAFAHAHVAAIAAERSVDSDSKARARCTLLLWNDLARPGGVESFVAWGLALCTANDSATLGLSDPSIVSWDSVRAIHRLFAVRSGLGADLAPFFELLARAARDIPAMPSASSSSSTSSSSMLSLSAASPSPPPSSSSSSSASDRAKAKADATPPTATAATPAIEADVRTVPARVVAEFVRHFALGFVDFFEDLGFVPSIPLDK